MDCKHDLCVKDCIFNIVYTDKTQQDYVTEVDNMREMVNSPDHYRGESLLEAIDVIEDFNLNFNLGNAIKYILRCNKKENCVQDLSKAMWYLNRELITLKSSLEDGET